MNAKVGVYPVLYLGQCIKYDDHFTRALIKVHNGTDWIWIDVPIVSKRQRHTVPDSTQLSPTLVVGYNKVHLSVPFQIPRRELEDSQKVCAIDLGINTTATASIVDRDGTVLAREFFHSARDIDRRDKRLKRISRKAHQTMGNTGKLAKGFSSGLFRKARHINQEIAQRISSAIVTFALEHKAPVIVFEYLKGWRPTGGRKGSTLRQRFHGWLHRRITKLVQEKFSEQGGKTVYVAARGTSKWAFDGTGPVQRSKENYALAVFASGKRYNADLNASYNIGASYWAKRLKLGGGNSPETCMGQRSRTVPRMPVTLSTLWNAEREAATTPALAG